MNVKISTLMMSLLMPALGFSAEYHVSVNGAGAKDDSSWENAIDFASFYAKVNDYTNGDTFYFSGGTYYAVSPTPTAITNGYTFIGGFAPTSTGTDHATPTYPSATPTIFSGDCNRNGVPDEADASRFLALKTDTKDSSKPFVIQGIEFMGAYDATSTKTHGALQLNNCGDVTVKQCRFYNNTTDAAGYGGMAITSYRSSLYLLDSEITHNSAVQRGGAIYVHVDGTTYTKGYTVIERCLIADNKVTDASLPLGSAICYTHGPALWIVNSTITGNESASGGAVFINGADTNWKRVLNIVGSTIAGNIGGNQIASTQGAVMHIANSYIVGHEDDGTTAKAAIAVTGATESNLFELTSKGYNIIGGYANALTNATLVPTWDATDSQNENNIYSTVFGTNILTDGVISPVVKTAGATGSALVSAMAKYDLATARANLTVDQLGTARETGMTAGAYAVNVTTGIHKVENPAKASIKGCYTLAGSIIDNPTQPGIYIVNGKKRIVK